MDFVRAILKVVNGILGILAYFATPGQDKGICTPVSVKRV